MGAFRRLDLEREQREGRGELGIVIRRERKRQRKTNVFDRSNFMRKNVGKKSIEKGEIQPSNVSGPFLRVIFLSLSHAIAHRVDTKDFKNSIKMAEISSNMNI